MAVCTDKKNHTLLNRSETLKREDVDDSDGICIKRNVINSGFMQSFGHQAEDIAGEMT